MSGIIDKRTIEMVFNNDSFEKNANTTLETLSKLKEALKFDKAVDGLSRLSNSAKNVGMDALANGVYSVTDKFNALDIAATRVIQNITDKIQGIFTSTLKSVTLEPIMSGLDEYTTQINSIQTILANTSDKLKEQGLSTEHSRIEKINGVLDDLNHYADMTIYNFTEMTRNIGTFTAAGVELDTAATSIKGIANLAAMSGASSQDASRAMYQLSQAIASGTVKLQDWNSVVNANMGGKLFQNELIDTAKAMGVTDEQFIKLTNGATTFRESLSSGWITSDVLTNTLEKFTAGSEGYTKKQVENMQALWKARGYSDTQIKELTGSITQLTDEQEQNLRTKWAEKGFSPEQIDHILEMGTAATDAATKVKTFSQLVDTVKEAMQSGWTQSWEYIFGDFEQAKMFWTEISDIMNMYIGKSANARNEMLKVWSKAKYSYNEDLQLIDAETGEVIEGQRMLADEMGGRELVIQGMRNTFQGLFEIANQFGKAWDDKFLGKTNENLEDLSMTGPKLIKLSRSFYDFSEQFKKSLGTDEKPTKMLKELREAFEWFANSSRRVVRGFQYFKDGIADTFKALFDSDIFSIDTLNVFLTMFSGISGRFKTVAEDFNKNFGNLTNSKNNKNYQGLLDFFNGLQDIVESVVFTKFYIPVFAFDALRKVIGELIPEGETIATLLGDLGGKFSELADSVWKGFNDDDVSKYETLFNNLADGIIKFKDSFPKEGADFSGLATGFEQLKGVVENNAFDIIANVLTTVVNLFKGLASFIIPVASAFSSVFLPSIQSVGDYVETLTDKIRLLSEKFVLSGNKINGVKVLFEGIFTVIKGLAAIIGDTLMGAWDGVSNLLSELLPNGQTVQKLLFDIGHALKDFGDNLIAIANGEAGVSSIGDMLSNFGTGLGDFIAHIKDVGILGEISEAISGLFSKIKEVAFGNSDTSFLTGALDAIKNFVSGLQQTLVGDNGFDIGDIFSAGGLAYGLSKFIELVKSIATLFAKKENSIAIIDNINSVAESLTDAIGAFQKKIQAGIIQKIAVSILALAVGLAIIASIDRTSLIQAVGAISILMNIMQSMAQSFLTMKQMEGVDLVGIGAGLKSMAEAVLLLAVAAKIMSSMKPDELAKGLGGTMALLMALTKVAQDLSKDEKRIKKGISGLVLLAIAVDLLVIAVKSLAKLSWEELEKGLLATIGLIFALTTAASRIGPDFSFGDGAGLLLLAIGIKTLANAVKELSTLNLGELFTGLGGVIVLLGAVTVSMKKLSESVKGGDALKIGAAILLMSIALGKMSEALISIAQLNPGQLATGLIGIAGGLAAMSIAIAAVSKFGSAGAALSLAALSVSLVALAYALKTLSGIEFTAMVGAIASVVVTLGALGLLAGVLAPVIPAMLGLAAAMALLGVAALAFGAGFLAISVAISGGGQLLIDFVHNLIMLIPTLAVEMTNASVQMLTAFIKGITDNIVYIVNAGFELLISFINSIADAVVTYGPQLADAVGNLVSAFIGFMEENGPKIIEAGEKIIGWIADGLGHLWNKITTKAGEIVGQVKQTIEDKVDEIRTAAGKLVSGFVEGLGSNFDGIINGAKAIGQTAIDWLTGSLDENSPSKKSEDAGMNFVLGFVNGISNNSEGAGLEIGSLVNVILTAFSALQNNDIVANIAAGMFSQLGNISAAAMQLITIITQTIFNSAQSFFTGGVTTIIQLASGFTSTMPKALSAVATIVNGAVTAITTTASRFLAAGVSVMSSFVSGVISNAGRALSAGTSLASNVVQGIRNGIGSLYSIGASAVQGFINGIASGAGGVWSAATSLASKALSAMKSALNINSPSKEMIKIGGSFVEGFVDGLEKYGDSAVDETAMFAATMLDTMESTIGKDVSPKISPVLDTSSFNSSVSDLNSIFNISGNLNGTVSMDYNREMISALADANSRGFSNLEQAIANSLDYDRLGVAVANAVSNMYVRVDGHEVIGYIASEVATGANMYGLS